MIPDEAVEAAGIVQFLEARITEDEEQAKNCQFLGWFPGKKYGMTTVSYARVLAECAAKRAIIEQHPPVDYSGIGMTSPDACVVCGIEVSMSDWEYARGSFPCDTLRALAAVYKDHPRYQQEWTA